MPFSSMLEVSAKDRAKILEEALKADYQKYLADYSPSMLALLFDWMENQDDEVKVNRTAHMAMQSLTMFLVALSPDDKDDQEHYRERIISYIANSFDVQMRNKDVIKKFVGDSIDDGNAYLNGVAQDNLRAEMQDLKKAIRELRRRRDS